MIVYIFYLLQIDPPGGTDERINQKKQTTTGHQIRNEAVGGANLSCDVNEINSLYESPDLRKSAFL
jgi:hypothetical protein